MNVTWEQLGSPTEPGIKDIAGIGTVLVTSNDLSLERFSSFHISLVDNEPESRYRIAGNVVQTRQVFFPTQ